MAQLVEVLAIDIWQPEFILQNPQKSGRGDPIPQNCPLVFIYTLVPTHKHPVQIHIHTIIVKNKTNKKEYYLTPQIDTNLGNIASPFFKNIL